jgi:hypothetical protein
VVIGGDRSARSSLIGVAEFGRLRRDSELTGERAFSGKLLFSMLDFMRVSWPPG